LSDFRRFTRRVHLSRRIGSTAPNSTVEAAPVVNTLLRALGAGADDTTRGEALAMLTLLGRRAGVLGITPTAALSLIGGLETAFADSNARLPEPLAAQVQTLAWEGYVQGREDRREEERATALALAHKTLLLQPRVPALVLSGEMDTPRLQRLMDRFGRELLRLDALSCVVEMSGLVGAAPDRASEVFSADGSARMLGARAFFSGASDEWLNAAKIGRVPLEMLHLRPTFAAAVGDALLHAGLAITPVKVPWWQRFRKT
jgi:hypothetical protein